MSCLSTPVSPPRASRQSMHTAAAEARLTGRKREMERCRMDVVMQPSRRWRPPAADRRNHASWSRAHAAGGWTAGGSRSAAVGHRARPPVPAASPDTATDALSSFPRGASTVYMTARLHRPTVRHAAADRFLTSCDRWYPDGCGGQARGWSTGKHYLPAAAAAANAIWSGLAGACTLTIRIARSRRWLFAEDWSTQINGLSDRRKQRRGRPPHAIIRHVRRASVMKDHSIVVACSSITTHLIHWPILSAACSFYAWLYLHRRRCHWGAMV